MTSYCEVCQQLFHIQQPQPCSLHSTTDNSREDITTTNSRTISPHNRRDTSNEQTNVTKTRSTPRRHSHVASRHASTLLTTPSPLPRRQASPLSRPPLLQQQHSHPHRVTSSPRKELHVEAQPTAIPSPEHISKRHKERRNTQNAKNSSGIGEDATAVLEDIVARLRAAVRTSQGNTHNAKEAHNHSAQRGEKKKPAPLCDVVETPDTPRVPSDTSTTTTTTTGDSCKLHQEQVHITSSSASTSLPDTCHAQQTTTTATTHSATTTPPPSTVRSTSTHKTNLSDSHTITSTRESQADDTSTMAAATSMPVLYKQMQLRQQSFQHELEKRVDELREGFVALCAAIEQDMQRLLVRSQQQHKQQQPVVSHKYDTRRHGRSVSEGGESYREVQEWTAGRLIAALEAASASQRRRVADLLNLPQHLADDKEYISREIQRQVQERIAIERVPVREECARLRDELRQSLKEASHKALAEQRNTITGSCTLPAGKENVNNNNTLGNTTPSQVDVSALMPSADVMAMHIRSAVRTVMSEQDTLGQRRIAALEQYCERRFRTQSEANTAALAEQAEQMEHYVQDALSREVRSAIRKHTTTLAQRLGELESVVERVQTQLNTVSAQGAEYKAQCEAEHNVQHKAQDALKQDLAALRQLVTGSTNNSNSSNALTTLPCKLYNEGGEHAEHYANAGDIRLEVIEPALAYVKRLLAAHQEMINTLVERRCTQAEGSVVQSRLQWDQHVNELRTRLQSLRYDTRNAFAELSQTLNIACPGI